MSSIYSNVQSVVTETGIASLIRWANPDSIGTLTITNLTQTGGMATAVCSTTNGVPVAFIAGDTVNIAGCTNAAYNGTGIVITGAGPVGSNSFTYAVPSGTPSPATILGTVQMAVPLGRINYWLLQADAWINSNFLAKQIYLRIGQASLGLGPVSAQMTQKWANAFVRYKLYKSVRGLIDDDPIRKALGSDLKEAEEQLAQCANDNGMRYGWDAQRTWPMAGGGSPVGYNPNYSGGWSSINPMSRTSPW